MTEPKRTAGKAEGTEKAAASAGAPSPTKVGEAGKTSNKNKEPGRTPGKAEG